MWGWVGLLRLHHNHSIAEFSFPPFSCHHHTVFFLYAGPLCCGLEHLYSLRIYNYRWFAPWRESDLITLIYVKHAFFDALALEHMGPELLAVWFLGTHYLSYIVVHWVILSTHLRQWAAPVSTLPQVLFRCLWFWCKCKFPLGLFTGQLSVLSAPNTCSVQSVGDAQHPKTCLLKTQLPRHHPVLQLQYHSEGQDISISKYYYT